MGDYELSSELIESVETFVAALKDHPGMIHIPKLGFFRDYLLSLGAKVSIVIEA